MQQNETIKQLHVRVSRHTKAKNGEETRFIGCWPVSDAARKIFSDAGVTEVQFDGDPKTFTIGSELKGDALIGRIEPAKARETDADGAETGKLVDRVKRDADGNILADKDGKPIVLKRVQLRWASRIQFARAKQTEEMLDIVDAIK